MSHRRDGLSGAHMFALGAGVVAAAAAAYFFLGPKGERHRAETKAWALKMRGEVMEKLEEAGDMTESAYYGIVDSVAAKYDKAMKESSTEIAALAHDLKKHWKNIGKSVREVQEA